MELMMAGLIQVCILHSLHSPACNLFSKSPIILQYCHPPLACRAQPLQQSPELTRALSHYTHYLQVLPIIFAYIPQQTCKCSSISGTPLQHL